MSFHFEQSHEKRVTTQKRTLMSLCSPLSSFTTYHKFGCAKSVWARKSWQAALKCLGIMFCNDRLSSCQNHLLKFNSVSIHHGEIAKICNKKILMLRVGPPRKFWKKLINVKISAHTTLDITDSLKAQCRPEICK